MASKFAYEAWSIDTLYWACLNVLLNQAPPVKSRGRVAREIVNATLILDDTRGRLVQNPKRNLQKPFAFGEFLWIMNGSNLLEGITPYNEKMADYSDDGVTMNAAYGYRIRERFGVDQLRNVVSALESDPGTRQALILIHDPLDVLKKTKDKACNVMLQYLLREGRLSCIATSRSCDIMYGFPYDLFHWSLLLEVIANTIGASAGSVYYNIGSLHLYEDQRDWAEEIVDYYLRERCVYDRMTKCESVLDKVFQYAMVGEVIRKNPSMGLVNDLIADPWWRDFFYTLVRRLLWKKRKEENV